MPLNVNKTDRMVIIADEAKAAGLKDVIMCAGFNVTLLKGLL